MSQYTLSDATGDDVPWLDDLRRQAYRPLFDATWGGWDEARHARHFAASLDVGGIAIVSVSGQRVGMLQLEMHRDAIEVHEIQVLPAHQNAGIGTAVLRDVMRSAQQQGIPVRLSTGLKNEAAKRLYERLGFRLTHTTETHFHLEFAAAATRG